MPFEISTEGTFSAAHFLEGYEGDCARLHGHNWRVRATLRAEKREPTGLTYDFRRLKALIGQVLQPLDHSVLNELPFFEGRNPTAEVIAEWCYGEISSRIGEGPVGVVRVEVWESPQNCAAYFKE
jgi:6-pyruvoyltetrahydropterin/6-carboxytetrahydropterin synthase